MHPLAEPRGVGNKVHAGQFEVGGLDQHPRDLRAAGAEGSRELAAMMTNFSELEVRAQHIDSAERAAAPVAATATGLRVTLAQ